MTGRTDEPEEVQVIVVFGSSIKKGRQKRHGNKLF
jgi:hypothetical protein